MLIQILTAHVLQRRVRTDEAEPFRVNVRNVLPLVLPDQRGDAALLIGLQPFMVDVLPKDPGTDLPGLTSTMQTYGPRWWLTCPKCRRRCTWLYWYGYRCVGRWACRMCLGIKYTSSATHRTVAGDMAVRQCGPFGNWAVYQRASEREGQRMRKLLRQVERLTFPKL